MKTQTLTEKKTVPLTLLQQLVDQLKLDVKVDYVSDVLPMGDFDYVMFAGYRQRTVGSPDRVMFNVSFVHDRPLETIHDFRSLFVQVPAQYETVYTCRAVLKTRSGGLFNFSFSSLTSERAMAKTVEHMAVMSVRDGIFKTEQEALAAMKKKGEDVILRKDGYSAYIFKPTSGLFVS